ncbi:hypothetical protein NQ314_015417 [Rhamnusium bicolor]|uniref:Uncharacterized protein n=1 Tax=Rhamnusium bicolor TaxID=1586634 RepID=A0AAV8WZ03_9CUCU|nr:hypothetical protein NQ314_015417 [Rhamnusium bicolor]
MEKRNIPNIKSSDTSQKKSKIKDLKKLIEGHWCIELSSLALKNLKEKQWEKPSALPLTSDIEKLKKFIDDRAADSFNKLKMNIDVKNNYKILTECLTLTVMFNRKRVGEVQYLKIDTYRNDCSKINQDSFVQPLSEIEKNYV